MAIQKKPPRETGAAAGRLAANVAGLRKARDMNQPQLAARLGELGVPMHATAVSKIETQERRVDADDLIALAVALDTTPNRLLLPASASEDEPVELTPEVRVSALDAWKWMTGNEPLPSGCAPPARQMLIRDDRERLFVRENQPHNVPEPFFHNVGHDMRDHPELAQMIAAVAVKAAESGVQLGRLTRMVEEAGLLKLFGSLDTAMDRLSEDDES